MYLWADSTYPLLIGFLFRGYFSCENIVLKYFLPQHNSLVTMQIVGTMGSGHVESNYGHGLTLIYFVVSVNNKSVYIVNRVSNCLVRSDYSLARTGLVTLHF